MKGAKTATNHSLATNFFLIFFDAGPDFWDISSLENRNKELTLSKRCSYKRSLSAPSEPPSEGAVCVSKATIQTNSCKAF